MYGGTLCDVCGIMFWGYISAHQPYCKGPPESPKPDLSLIPFFEKVNDFLNNRPTN